MGYSKPDLLVVFKEIERKTKPFLNLKNQQDYDLLIRILRLVQAYKIKLDVEAVSRVRVNINLFERLKANLIMNDSEKLLHDYFFAVENEEGFEVEG